MANYSKVRELTYAEQEYVRIHHKTATVIEMAQALRCRKGSVFKFMDENNLQVLRKARGGRPRSTVFYSKNFVVDARDWFIG